MAEESYTLTRILERGTQLFVKHGYRGLSMREIAAAVGLSKPALYYHFKDKESLFVAVLGHHLETFGQLVEQAKTQRGTYAQLEHFLKLFFALPVSSRKVITLSTQEMVHLSQQQRQAFAQRYAREFLQPLEGIIQEGLMHKEIRPIDTKTALQLFLGLIFPFISSPSKDGVVLAQTIVDTYWYGVGIQASAER